jgi:hypothetical protein
MINVINYAYKEIVRVLANQGSNFIDVDDIKIEIPFEDKPKSNKSKTQPVRIILNNIELEDDDLEDPRVGYLVENAIFKILQMSEKIKADRIKEILGGNFEEQPSKENKWSVVKKAMKKALWL